MIYFYPDIDNLAYVINFQHFKERRRKIGTFSGSYLQSVFCTSTTAIKIGQCYSVLCQLVACRAIFPVAN